MKPSELVVGDKFSIEVACSNAGVDTTKVWEVLDIIPRKFELTDGRTITTSVSLSVKSKDSSTIISLSLGTWVDVKKVA
jgi:hypothetical protein